MDKPEALRLADALSAAIKQVDVDDDVIHVARWFVEDASTELRRQHGEIKSMRAERLRSERRLSAVEAQRDALLGALKLTWPIIEKEKFMQDGCYGKNFNQTKAERARKAYEATRAAIKAVEEGK